MLPTLPIFLSLMVMEIEVTILIIYFAFRIHDRWQARYELACICQAITVELPAVKVQNSILLARIENLKTMRTNPYGHDAGVSGRSWSRSRCD